MKKYSSYANLKISPNNKLYPIDCWPQKITTTPSTRKAIQTPLMVITKQPYAVPMTTKYSAGYLQRQKMFSNKKQNKDVTNVKVNVVTGPNITISAGGYDSKLLLFNRPASSKSKRNHQEKQRSIKKDKPVRSDKFLDLENKENLFDKQLRYEVQSPKGNVNRTQQFKQKEKSKPKVQEKQKQKQKSHKTGLSINNAKIKQKKQQQKLNQYVTKYEPEPKSILLHCTSQSNLIKTINLQQKKSLKGYYKSVLYQAFFGSKTSSIHQICRNHLVTSMQFLTYAKRNKHIIPPSVSKLNLPPTNRKTLIFDLDETLIHCNETLDKPHDVALEITFPNNSKIKAGINVRPYAVECLKELSKYFQVIVFTASHECYANVIVDYLDPNHEYISHRFFRETCYKTEQGFYVKDLRVFNRDLANVLLIDNVIISIIKAAYSYCFQPENGVPIIPFYNNKADLQLKEVTSYLKQFVDVKNMRIKNENYMRLADYHHFSCPKQLINQLYY